MPGVEGKRKGKTGCSSFQKGSPRGENRRTRRLFWGVPERVTPSQPGTQHRVPGSVVGLCTNRLGEATKKPRVDVPLPHLGVGQNSTRILCDFGPFHLPGLTTTPSLLCSFSRVPFLLSCVKGEKGYLQLCLLCQVSLRHCTIATGNPGPSIFDDASSARGTQMIISVEFPP